MKIIDNMTTYNNDKMKHFILNQIPAIVGYAAAMFIPGAYEYRKATGMALACIAAYAKEQWDKTRPTQHTSDGLDFVSGMAGATALIACLP